MPRPKKSRLGDADISRVYACTEEDCEAEFLFHQKIKDDFIKECPVCHKLSLVITQAKSNISFIFDSKKAKTFGMQSQRNLENDEKAGNKSKIVKKKKVDYDILKDPKKYIMTGEK